MEIPSWLWQGALSGVVATILFLQLQRAGKLALTSLREWRAREAQANADAARRIAFDTQRLIILFFGFTLSLLSILFGGLGLSLLAYKMATPEASRLFYVPIVVFSMGLVFCGRGMAIVNQAMDHVRSVQDQQAALVEEQDRMRDVDPGPQRDLNDF